MIKISKDENMLNTKKIRITKKFIGIHGGWGRANMLVTDSGRKFETTSRTVNYRNTNLSYDMLYYGVS